MSETYALGLSFIAPSEGDTSWASVEDAKNIRISQHDHTGGGMGAQITSAALAANAVGGAALRLANNTSLRARNYLDSADIDILKVSTTDNILSLQQFFAMASTETVTAGPSVSNQTTVSLLNGTSLNLIMASGAAAGQLKVIVNINSTVATVTPNATAGPNTISLPQYGAAVMVFVNSEWRILAIHGGSVTDDIQTTTASSGTYSITGRIFTFNNAGATTATFNVGAAGQRVTVYNIGAGSVALTLTGRPAASDVVTIATGGIVELVMINSTWQPIAGNVVTITYA